MYRVGHRLPFCFGSARSIHECAYHLLQLSTGPPPALQSPIFTLAARSPPLFKSPPIVFRTESLVLPLLTLSQALLGPAADTYHSRISRNQKQRPKTPGAQPVRLGPCIIALNYSIGSEAVPRSESSNSTCSIIISTCSLPLPSACERSAILLKPVYGEPIE